MHWTQVYDPLGHWWLSTLVAALPILVLLTLLAGFHVRPHLCALCGAVTAFAVSVAIFHMPAMLASASLLYGVAIAGAFMIGLGFKPFQAAVLNLIANTAPVAWGAIGTPVHTLALVTALPESDLNAMIGRILPFASIIVPFWLVRAMVGWAET